MVKVAVLVSGGGTNLQALIDAEKVGKIKNGKISLVVSSKVDAFALERSKKTGITTKVVLKSDFCDNESYNEALIELLKKEDIGLIVLAGFMTVLSKKFCKSFNNKIINVHPSLIPSFCGDGYYGLRVHEEVLKKGVKVTGATVHFVNEITDGGAIIAQKAVNVKDDDTAEVLQKRVMKEAEHVLLPEVTSLFCEGKIIVKNSIAYIKK